jgi:hypothetical protein
MLNVFFKDKLLKQTDAFSLSVFRIAFSILLFIEVCSYIYYYAIINQEIPFVSDFNYAEYGALYGWLFVVAALGLGLYTNYVAIINYCFAVYFFGTDLGHNYHVHYIFLCASALMVFMPLNQSISIDRLLAKAKGKHTTDTVPAFVYMAYALFLLGFVYFDSSIWKLDSVYWTKGLCLWIGTSYVPIIKYDFSFLLNNETLMVMGNYASLAFETLFIFLLPWRKTRLLLVAYGVPMHLLIAIIYPLPLFGLLFSVNYIILVPSSYWRWLFGRKWLSKLLGGIKALLSKLPIPYLPNIGFSVNVKLVILFLLVVNQAIATIRPTLEKVRVHLPGYIANTSRTFYGAYYKLGIEHFTGVTHHSLFLDNHFAPRNVYALYYQNPKGDLTQVPVTDYRGLHSPETQNIGWKLWCFYTMEEDEAAEMFIKFSAFWAHHNHVNLSDATFVIKYKYIEAPQVWEKDFLQKQIDIPWKPYSTLVWKDKHWSHVLVDRND